MCKEYFEQCYEMAIERICDEYNIEGEEAQKRLEDLLKSNPHYLDGYLAYDPE